MSIDKQRKLQYIPIVHLIVVYYLFKLFQTHAMTMRWFFKFYVTVCGGILVVGLTRVLLLQVFKNDLFESVSFGVSIYLYVWVLARVSIKVQEKQEKNDIED